MIALAEEKEGKEEQEQKKEKKEANEPKEDYKDRLLRLAAEFDNYKKRIKTDIEGAKGIGRAEFAKSLLPILDEFELALVVVRKSDDKNMVKGVELLYSNFYDVMKKSGLAEVECNGVFDPYKHEIVMTQEDDAKPGTVIEVTKKGYTFNGILLRPASVIVSKEREEEAERKNDK